MIRHSALDSSIALSSLFADRVGMIVRMLGGWLVQTRMRMDHDTWHHPPACTDSKTPLPTDYRAGRGDRPTTERVLGICFAITAIVLHAIALLGLCILPVRVPEDDQFQALPQSPSPPTHIRRSPNRSTLQHPHSGVGTVRKWPPFGLV